MKLYEPLRLITPLMDKKDVASIHLKFAPMENILKNGVQGNGKITCNSIISNLRMYFVIYYNVFL